MINNYEYCMYKLITVVDIECIIYDKQRILLHNFSLHDILNQVKDVVDPLHQDAVWFCSAAVRQMTSTPTLQGGRQSPSSWCT